MKKKLDNWLLNLWKILIKFHFIKLLFYNSIYKKLNNLIIIKKIKFVFKLEKLNY